MKYYGNEEKRKESTALPAITDGNPVFFYGEEMKQFSD